MTDPAVDNLVDMQETMEEIYTPVRIEFTLRDGKPAHAVGSIVLPGRVRQVANDGFGGESGVTAPVSAIRRILASLWGVSTEVSTELTLSGSSQRNSTPALLESSMASYDPSAVT